MKAQRNIFIATMFLMITCFSVSLQANDANRDMIVRITKLNATTVNVQLANIQQPTEIKIVDLNGQSWFSAIVKKKNAYAKQLDLSLVPSGNYIVYVKNSREKHVQAFVKNEKDIAFFESSDAPASNEVYAQLASQRTKAADRLITKIKTNGDAKIEVQLANLLEKNVSVQIRFLSGVELVRDQVKGYTGYAKTFNCEGMVAGDYYVLIRTGKTTLLQYFTISESGLTMEHSQRMDGTPNNLDWAVK